MARTGRPAKPLFELTAVQEEFYTFCVVELLGGNLELVPKDPLAAFRAGVALSRQYAKFANARRETEQLSA